MPASAPVDDPVLYDVFLRYVQFGNRTGSLASTPERSSQSGTPQSHLDITTPLLDGTKFAKLIREAGLIDATVTSTNVDILFSRVKDRGERRLNFLQFRMALKLLAEKKYANEQLVDNGEEGEELVLEAVRKVKGPQLIGITQPDSSETMERLMDAPDHYITRSPASDIRPWKDNLRRASSPTAYTIEEDGNGELNKSRRSSMLNSAGLASSPSAPSQSRKSSVNPSQLSGSTLNSSPLARRLPYQSIVR